MTTNDDPQGHLLEDDPGIYLDLLAERDEAIEKAGRLQARVVELEGECDQWQRKVADLWSESLRREAEIGRLTEEANDLDSKLGSALRAIGLEHAENERLNSLNTEHWDALRAMAADFNVVLGTIRAENERLHDAAVAAQRRMEQFEVEIERLRALVADIRRLHDSPLHQSFAGSCDGCEALAAFDEQLPDPQAHSVRRLPEVNQ